MIYTQPLRRIMTAMPVYPWHTTSISRYKKISTLKYSERGQLLSHLPPSTIAAETIFAAARSQR